MIVPPSAVALLVVLLTAALGMWSYAEMQHAKHVRDLHRAAQSWRMRHLTAMREFARVSVLCEHMTADCRRRLRAAGIDDSAYEKEMGEMYAYRAKVRAEFELHNMEGS